MAIRFTLGGMQFEVDSAKEARAIAAEFLSDPLPEASDGDGAAADEPDEAEEEAEAPDEAEEDLGDPELARQFLQAVIESGPEGADATSLAPILGFTHPKGLGSRMAGINAAIRRTGVPVDEAVRVIRTRTGRRWLPSRMTSRVLHRLG